MIELENEPFARDAEDEQNRKSALRSVFFSQTETNQNKTINFPPPESLAVFTLGVLLPALAIAVTLTAGMYAACGVLLRHWVETLLQFGLLLSVPIGIYHVWKKVEKNDLRRARLTGHLIGLSTGAAFITSIITTLALALRYPTQDGPNVVVSAAAGVIGSSNGVLQQAWNGPIDASPIMTRTFNPEHFFDVSVLSVVAWLATFTAIYVAIKFRNIWTTRGARMSASLHILLGAVLAFFTLSATEAKSACIRIAEHLAVYGTPEQKKEGLAFLQGADCERTLRMDCSNSKANGISEMFMRLDDAENKKLYFLATGQPFRFDLQNAADFAALPDEMLGRQVVGDKVSNLRMAHSLISGSVHPESLTSTLDWTFVFQNTGFNSQEARAEIGLPKDAVVSDMVLWMNGVPKRAAIGSTSAATEAYRWVTGGRRDPALVTDLGKGRVLIQCNPVPAQGEMKIKVTMKAAMKMDEAGEAVLSLPTLIKSNFEVKGDHRLQLRSEGKLKINLDNMRQFAANNGLNVVTGDFSSAHRSKESVDVRIERDSKAPPIAVRDPIDGTYIVQTFKPVLSVKPDHLVVVVDGSSTMAEHKAEIINQLKKLPKELPTSLIVASVDFPDRMQFEPLNNAIKAMDRLEFRGGQENLSSVAKAAELAGETEGGAVLWIHGPQPALDKEMYIVAPYLVKPRFFEMSIEDSVTDVNEFFKNHQEIGPFTPLARNTTFSADLHRFLDKWQTDGVDYTLAYTKTSNPPARVSNSAYVTDEVSRLFAAQRVREMFKRGARGSAETLAARYEIVSPVTSAVVLEHSTDYQRYGLREPAQTDGSAALLANLHPGSPPLNKTIGKPWHSPRIARNNSYKRKTGAGHIRIASSQRSRTTGSAWQMETPSAKIDELTIDSGEAAQARVDLSETSWPAPYVVAMPESNDSEGGSSEGGVIGSQTMVTAEPGSGFGDAFAGAGVPSMQGATNGSIGPQGADATSIAGVNTAGTIRVDNLANLDAMLNLLAHSTQLIGLAGGGILFFLGFFKSAICLPGASGTLSRSHRLILGGVLIIIGLITPSFLNFMVASARDANLFS